ncbi:MAG: phosphoglycerate dehydrogenase, partial [Dehalococcoidales bacterium]|nr:phosphoglycerate dehydrogenase [Dehalococcoidales bacterium]
FAAQRGLKIAEEKNDACQNYASLITVSIVTSTGTTTVAGTVINGQTHIVRVNDYWLDMVPAGGYFLFSNHTDRPGLIGAVGKITGDADVNISSMHLGRLEARGPALLVLALDEPLPEASIKKILALKDVKSAKLVQL